MSVPMPTKTELADALDEVHALQVRADTSLLTTVALMCEAWSVTEGSAFSSRDDNPHVLFAEQLVSPGGDGTPQVAEFLALEIGPRLHISPGAAHSLIADVLNLRHRLPILWEHAVTGRVRAWIARKIAQTTAHLSCEAARELDSYVSPTAAAQTPTALLKNTDRWVLLLDPDRADRRERALAHRRVTLTPDPATGTTVIDARLDASAAAHLDTTLDRGARTLATGGLSDTHQVLRARALELLAHPARAHLILDQSLPFTVDPAGQIHPDKSDSPDATGSATSGTCRHGAELVVRVTASDLRRGHGCDLEGFGPITQTHLTQLLAGCATVTVRPVLDLAAPNPVAVYRPPATLRWQVAERDQRELFPHSTRSSRSRQIDQDHTLAWSRGGTTSSHNLGSLSRRVHRAVTHAGFVVTQPTPGTLHWRTPTGKESWTNAHGTWDHPPPDHGPINDPDATTSAVLATALQIITQRATHDAPTPPPPRSRPPRTIWPPTIGPLQCAGPCPREPHPETDCAPPF